MDATKLGIALLALCPLAVTAQQPAQATVEQFENLLREIRGLQEYNALRERQIGQQEIDIARLQAAIGDVPDLELQLPPLLIRMVDGLREFAELDYPLPAVERTDRINALYALIEDSSVNDAAKLRNILEAWMIEVEYGSVSNFKLYEGKMPIGNPDRDVDFVSLGRVGLIHQTQDDEALTGAWDYRTSSWVELGTEHRKSVRQVIRMARSQIAPELVLLPTVPPQND
jgi:hypothetical protein